MPTTYSIEDAPTKYSIEDDSPTPAPMGMRDTAIHTFDPLTPEQRTALTSKMGNTAGNLTASFADTALGVGQGIESFFYHPLSAVFSGAQQAVDALNQTTPDSMLSPQGKAEKQAGVKRLKDQWEAIKDNPDFSLGNMLGTILVAHSAGEAIGPVARGLREKAASARNSALGQLTKTSPAETADLVKETKDANETATAKAAETNAAQDATRKAELQKHFDKTQKVKADNEAGEAVPARKEALNRGVEQLEKKAHDDLKTARDDAAKAANKKYTTLNSALGEQEIQSDTLLGHLLEASEKIKGSDTKSPILKDIEKNVKSSNSISYEDLQGYYSELGHELSKGSLPGDVYTAYNTLQEAIGGEMQRIADRQGMGPQLTDARATWRNLKQTFYDPNSPISQAIKVGDSLKRKPGSVMNAFQGKDAAIEALAKYDPGLADRINTIRGHQAEAKSITAKQAPAKPMPTLSDKPTPVTPETKTISAEDIRGAKAQGLEERATFIKKRGGQIAATFGVYRILESVVHGNIAALPADFAGAIAGYGATQIIGKLLEVPAVRDFLTKPTARDLAQVPPGMRGDMSQIVQIAKSKGIRVDPQLSVLLGIAAVPNGQKTQKLQQLRDHGRYAQVATHNETGHRIGSNDGENWVDTETGEPVNAH